MKQLFKGLFRRETEEQHRFLSETKINNKLWNDMLKDIKR